MDIFFSKENESAKVTTASRFFPARSLDKLYNFADCAGLHLIFGINALHRNPDNSWNASSALSLLKYSAGKKYNISWELGNGKYYTNWTRLFCKFVALWSYYLLKYEICVT